ncbi:P22 coat protein [Caudoviricetes sp.]|nr:P22 coat protein [Caudoviricetes sp.]
MSNTLKFIDMVAREALAVGHEKAQFIGTTDRQYDDSFAKTGAKIGNALRVRNANKYTVREGSRVMDVQDQNESTQTITLATQSGVDMRFNSAELTLDTDNPNEVAAFTKRYIEPAASVLMSKIESNFLTYATQRTANMVGQGASAAIGTAITTLAAPGIARARLNQQLAPKGDRNIQMDSITMAGLVSGVAAYFNPSGAISEQYKEGLIARTSMADYYENERCWTMPNSADVAGTLDTYTVVEGDTDLTVTGFSAAPVAGMVFTIAGLYDCHPETKAAYSHLKQFTVTSATTTVINFLPAISLSGAGQNVSGSAATTAAVAFAGSASTSYVQSLMYHKDAFQFVTADLPIMDDAHKCTRRTQDGISMRVWMASDIRNDELLMRLDILHGYAALRPEWACRIA